MSPNRNASHAHLIPYVTADEARHLLRTELARLLALLEDLAPDEWTLPTACSGWTVRDIVAHQAGGYASGSGYREMIRQYTALPQRGKLPEDLINERQLRERAQTPPVDLIAELRAVGPVACENWASGFRLIKPITVPHPVGGRLSVRHLMWVIHSRDTWMHRLDICRATGRQFHQTTEHDGRIAALVMRDASIPLQSTLDRHAVEFDLTGTAGGAWQIGPGEPIATIHMDALDFSIYASGRFNYDEIRERASVTGDDSLAEAALRKLLILF